MSLRAKIWFPCALLTALALLVSAGHVAARPLVARDGKIHACYKFRGKHKGALRVVHGPRVRCRKKWRKVAWYVRPPVGSQGASGPQGAPGPPGPIDTAAVEGLEGKVTELLGRVESLEAVLKGVSNAELLAAIADTKALCTQVSTLTTQLDSVEEALGGLKLNTVLTALGGVLEIPTLPGALSAFSCPS